MQMLVAIGFLWNIEIIYFGSFGVEHVPKEINEFIGHKNVNTYLEFSQIIQ